MSPKTRIAPILPFAVILIWATAGCRSTPLCGSKGPELACYFAGEPERMEARSAADASATTSNTAKGVPDSSLPEDDPLDSLAIPISSKKNRSRTSYRPTISLARSNGPNQLFNWPDGHRDTTYLVALAAGFDTSEAKTLAFFAEYPDLDSDYDAVHVAVADLLLPWRWPWRKDVMAGLHSLHGGDQREVEDRRAAISKAIQRSLAGGPADLWRTGLMIHALGDSYAHTDGSYDSKEETAYGYIVGHAFAWHNPDQLAYPRTFEKYSAYVRELYRDFASVTKEGDPGEIEKLLAVLSDIVCTCECNCDAEAKKKMTETVHDFAGGFDNSDPVVRAIERNIRPLTEAEVQSTIDEMLNQ